MKAICVDDEQLALELIKQKLKKIEDVTLLGTFNQSEDALTFVNQTEVDVVFLDINMPGVGGMELAEDLRASNEDLAIVFITAYQHYAVDAFHLNAVDYLVKPIQTKRLEETIKRVRERINVAETSHKTDKLSIKLMGYLAFKYLDSNYQIKNWRTKKTEELFLLLLQSRDKVVSKYDIKSIIWQDIDKDDAILHTTIYNIRKTLKDYTAFIEILHTNNGYMLQLNHTEIDTTNWEQKAKHIGNLTRKNLEKYEQLFKENHAAYLKDKDFIWLMPERERLDQLWLKIAKALVDYYTAHHNLQAAIKVYEKMIERFPDEEDYYFLLMKQHYANQDIRQLNVVYDNLVHYLQTTLEEKPSEHIQAWRQQVLI